jgi:hypothetical protein
LKGNHHETRTNGLEGAPPLCCVLRNPQVVRSEAQLPDLPAAVGDDGEALFGGSPGVDPEVPDLEADLFEARPSVARGRDVTRHRRRVARRLLEPPAVEDRRPGGVDLEGTPRRREPALDVGLDVDVPPQQHAP